METVVDYGYAQHPQQYRRDDPYQGTTESLRVQEREIDQLQPITIDREPGIVCKHQGLGPGARGSGLQGCRGSGGMTHNHNNGHNTHWVLCEIQANSTLYTVSIEIKRMSL